MRSHTERQVTVNFKREYGSGQKTPVVGSGKRTGTRESPLRSKQTGKRQRDKRYEQAGLTAETPMQVKRATDTTEWRPSTLSDKRMLRCLQQSSVNAFTTVKQTYVLRHLAKQAWSAQWDIVVTSLYFSWDASPP